MGNFQPREFRIGSEYYRWAFYAAATWSIGFVAGYWAVRLAQFGNPLPGWLWLYEVPIGFGPPAGLVLLAYRWRVRIDERGVSQRWLFRWNLWSWEAFEAGRIHKGVYPYSYRIHEKSSWHHNLLFLLLGSSTPAPSPAARQRTLLLTLLDDEDRNFLSEICRRVWVPPPPPKIPDEITIKLELSLHRVRFSAVGLHCGTLFKRRYYAWNQVQELRILRLDHDHYDFSELTLVLPDRTLELGVKKLIGLPVHTWRGADADVIAGFLERHVPPERVRMVTLYGPPKSPEEIEERLAEFDREERRDIRSQRRTWGYAVIHGASILFFARFLMGPIQTLTVALLTVLAVWGPPWTIRHFKRVERRKEQERLELYRSGRHKDWYVVSDGIASQTGMLAQVTNRVDS